MIKNYIADFPSKNEMKKFIEEYKDIIKVIRTKKHIIYPYKDNKHNDNGVQYEIKGLLYYEADGEPLIEANNKIFEELIKEK